MKLKCRGKYMAVSVLFSVLPVSFCQSLGTAPETDQRLTLIHSEWSRRRDRELCDYWTLTLYQFQSFYNAAVTHKVYYALRLITWDPVVRVLLIMREILAFFMRERRNFVIKSATGSNRLIALKVQWKRHALSFATTTAALTTLKAIVRHVGKSAYLLTWCK